MDVLLFWVAAAFLTTIVTLTVLWPVFRRREAEAPSRAAYDVEIYGAQLGELRSDLERGAIRPEEAETARAEIGRRLLRAASQAEADKVALRPQHRRTLTAAAFLVGIGLPAASLFFYARLGSPAMPDLPLAVRLSADPATADLPTLVAQAEAKLRRRPEDGAGWEALGRVYLESGRADEAAAAIGNAIRLLGPTPEREASLGEAETQAANGDVTDAARASFERALALDPAYLPAKFFLALDLSQEGRFTEAAPAWRSLIDLSPKDAPWLKLAVAAREDAEGKTAAAGAGGALRGLPAPDPRGPTSGDVAAAAVLSGSDRSAMIEGMVSQLADRLKTAPNDVEGWKRLMQSYTVLGDNSKAEAALKQADAVFPDGSPEQGAISAFAATLGLTAAKETTTR